VVLPARRSHIAASLAQTLGLVTDECSCRKAPPHRTQSVRPSGRPLRWACPAGPVGMGGRQPGRSLRPNHGAVTHHVMRRTLRGGATITAPGVRPEKILLRRSRPGARRQSDEPSPLTTSPPTEPPASCASGPDAFATPAKTRRPDSRVERNQIGATIETNQHKTAHFLVPLHIRRNVLIHGPVLNTLSHVHQPDRLNQRAIASSRSSSLQPFSSSTAPDTASSTVTSPQHARHACCSRNA
jgi:hypothetical protein